MTTNKKAKILTIVLSCVFSVFLVLGIVLGAVLGFNQKTEVKTLTVTIDQFSYATNLEKFEEEFDKVFEDMDVEVVDKEYGEMAVENEILYFVDKDTDVEKVKAELREVSKKIIEEQGADIIWQGGNETQLVSVPSGYITRGIIASAVFAVIAFLYVFFRYRWDGGVVMFLSVLFAIGATTAIILLTRIPASNSTMYAIIASGLLSAVMVLFNLNKVRMQAEEESEECNDCPCALVATKKIALVSATMLVALALIAIVGGGAIAWTAVCTMIGTLVAALIALVYATSLLAVLKVPADAMAKAKGKTYQGAPKTSERIKKIFAKFKKNKSKTEEVEEEPVEEATEEAEAEEPVEEAEEPAKEVAEETATEEAEAEADDED